MNSATVRSLDQPVRYVPSSGDNGHYKQEIGVDRRAYVVGGGSSRGGGASPTDAAVALSQLPVLGRFREGLDLLLAMFVIVANFAALVGLMYYFRTTCTSEYGVLPNAPGDPVPPALAGLEDQGGVTVTSRSLVYFQANDTYSQGGLTFWTPFQTTCGCPECNLASCGATVPIVVEYEQCTPWPEVLALAAALVVYVNVAFAAFFAVVLGVIPCVKKAGATGSTFWDFIVSVSQN